MDELQKFLDRKKEIIRNWKMTGLLGGITAEFEQEQMAVILENQRLDNEMNVEERDNPKDPNLGGGYYGHFRRISIPLVRRMYNPNAFLGFKIVSVQSMMAPEHSFFYRDRYGNLKAVAVRAKVRKTKVPIPPLGRVNEDLGEEAKMLAIYSNELMREMSGEIVMDLWNNAASKFQHVYRSRQHLEDYIRVAAANVEKKSGFSPNWIVTSPNVAYPLLEKKIPEINSDDISTLLPEHAGDLANKWKVYSNPVWPDDRILLGFKGDPYTAGYFYCPFVPAFFMPGEAPSEGSHWDYRIMTRYGKAMPFPQFYGSIKVEGYSYTPEEKEEDHA